MVKAHSIILWATLLFSITSQAPPGSPSGSMLAAVVKDLVGTCPALRRIPTAGPITAFIRTPRTTESLAGLTIILLLHFTAGCNVSWNDFNVGGGALFVSYSTDNGATWTNVRQLTSGTPFIRDVQITGDLVAGDVYVAGMDE